MTHINTSYEIVWVDWPHVKKPYSERELAFIETLKPKEDTMMLAKYIKFRDVNLTSIFLFKFFY